MDVNYDSILGNVLEWEGGYSNDEGDSGGPTKYGITIHDARLYWKKNATAADVRAMPLSVAKQIYRERYWTPVRGADLPSGVDYSVMDYGVNSGIARSAMVLQRIIGVADDGRIGPITLAATKAYVDKYGAKQLVAKLNDERLAFLKRLSIWGIFGRGWARRVAGVKKTALAMATT